jgi:hypothetical protein
MLDPKITRSDFEMDTNLLLDVCCESDCNIPVTVDKDLKEKGRKTRCTACMIRFKLKK